MPLTLTLNGQQRLFDDLVPGTTLAGLVATLGLKSDRIALELNGEIVARATWAKAPLADGDRLELVHFVGGGIEVASLKGSHLNGQDAWVSVRRRFSQRSP